MNNYVRCERLSKGKLALLLLLSVIMVFALAITGLNLGGGQTVAYAITPETPYVTFSSDSTFTLATGNSTKNWNGTLEYSTDTTTWLTWSGTAAINSSAEGKLYLRGISNTIITGSSNNNYRWVLDGSNIACSGNIENLLDHATVTGGSHPTMAGACYSYMFYGCTALTTAPTLPATTLKYDCYQYMFSGCTSLTTAPTLPATTAQSYCYYSMFMGCTSLTTAPTLPATTLAWYCYQSMFAGCTSLITAPNLPATALENGCYLNMFSGCSSLNVSATRLNASSIEWRIPTTGTATEATGWNYNMLSSTGDFTGNPTIGTTYYITPKYSVSLNENSGSYVSPYTEPTKYTYGAGLTLPTSTEITRDGFIFEGWTATNDTTDKTYITTISTTDTGNKTYYAKWASYITFSSDSTFTVGTYNNAKNWGGTLEYSTNLSSWSTWAGTSAISSSVGGKLYLRGTGNTYITGFGSTHRWVLTGSSIACSGNIENLLDYATVALGNHPTMANYCYVDMFNSCTALTTAPTLPATTLANYCYYGMFSGCTALTAAPTLPATDFTNASYCYQGMFSGCTALTAAPTLPATNLTNATHCYYEMFSGCTALTTAPTTLPATTLVDSCYYSMFQGCTSLTTAPALPAETVTDDCYRNMFYGCTALTTAPTTLPATTLAGSCYSAMFQGCTSLTTAPNLFATTLASNCCQNMFSGCSSLNVSVSAVNASSIEWRIPTTGSATIAANWNILMLSNTGGTFTDNPSINTTYYITPKYSVLLNENSGSYVSPYTEPTKYTYGAGLTLPTSTEITRDGFIFEGWTATNDTTDKTYITTISTTDTGNKTYYAKWSAYVTFSSDSTFTLATYNSTKNWNGTLEYSTNLSSWSTWSGTAAINSSAEGKLYLRGISNTIITGSSNNCRWVLTGSNIACSGNIENLLDYATVALGNHPTMADYCYSNMFYGCTALTTAPNLHATTLASYCYSAMFQGCSSLNVSVNAVNASSIEWRIPPTGIATYATNWNDSMLEGTGGTFTDGPSINPAITYYITPKYSVSLNENGGSYVSPYTEPTKYTYGTGLTLPTSANITRTGYTFNGWTATNDAYDATTNPYITSISTTETGDKTYYAKWTVNEYTITFDSNGGSSVTAITQDYNTTVIKPTDPTKTGYSFGGWFTDDDTFANAFTLRWR